MTWFDDMVLNSEKVCFNGREESMAYEFKRLLAEFIESDGDLLGEVVRLEATERLAMRKSPELLKKLKEEEYPEDAEAKIWDSLYEIMMEASKREEKFIFIPPPDKDEFITLFSIYLAFGGATALTRALLEESSFTSFYYPYDTCRLPLENAGESPAIHVFSANWFLTCLPEFINKSERKFYLYLREEEPEAKKIELFLRYMTRTKTDLEINPTAPAIYPKDYVILDPKEDFEIFSGTPDGVRFFLFTATDFFSSLKTSHQKRLSASHRMEKLIFFPSKDVLFKGLLLKKGEKPEDKLAVEARGSEHQIPSHVLKYIPMWREDVLLGEHFQDYLSFFKSAPKINLGEVAEIKRGCVEKPKITLRGKHTHLLLRGRDLNDGIIDVASLKGIVFEDEDCPALKPGDIVISPEGIKIGEVPRSQEKILPLKELVIVRPHAYSPTLLRFFLTSEVGKSLLSEILFHPFFASDLPRLKGLPIPMFLDEKEMKEAEKALLQAEEEYRNACLRAKEEFLRKTRPLEEKLLGKRRRN